MKGSGIMKRNYRVVTAFVLTLLLVFGSFGMVYADNTNVEIKQVPNNVENITMDFNISGGGILSINLSPKSGGGGHWNYIWSDEDKTNILESLNNIKFYDSGNILIDTFFSQVLFCV